MRKPNPAEYADAWTALAFKINLYRTITMSHEGVLECLKRIDSFVIAHSSHNGERSFKEIEDNVNEAFWKQIAGYEPVPLPKREGRNVKRE